MSQFLQIERDPNCPYGICNGELCYVHSNIADRNPGGDNTNESDNGESCAVTRTFDMCSKMPLIRATWPILLAFSEQQYNSTWNTNS